MRNAGSVFGAQRLDFSERWCSRRWLVVGRGCWVGSAVVGTIAVEECAVRHGAGPPAKVNASHRGGTASIRRTGRIVIDPDGGKALLEHHRRRPPMRCGENEGVPRTRRHIAFEMVADEAGPDLVCRRWVGTQMLQRARPDVIARGSRVRSQPVNRIEDAVAVGTA